MRQRSLSHSHVNVRPVKPPLGSHAAQSNAAFRVVFAFVVGISLTSSCGKAPPREVEPEPRSKVVFPERPGAAGVTGDDRGTEANVSGVAGSEGTSPPLDPAPGSETEGTIAPRLAPSSPAGDGAAQPEGPDTAVRAPVPALDPVIQADVAAMAATLEISGVELGIAVLDLSTGAVIAESNGARALNPASNEKLATTATALTRLGPDHRFESTLELVGTDLVLRGNGNPTLTTAALQTMIDTAKVTLGKKSYKDVLVDESGFSGSALPPGFGKKLTDAAYRAATGMTVVDEGTFKIQILPTRVGEPVTWELTPPGDYFTIDNRGKGVAGKKGRIGVETALEANRTRLVIRGKLGVEAKTKPITVRRVEHPSLATASALHALAKRAGIRLSGTARVVNTRPAAGQLLASVTSPPLSEIVTRVNKESNNFLAEMLLRALALHGRLDAAPALATPPVAPGAAPPVDPNSVAAVPPSTAKVPTLPDWSTGTAVVRDFLEREVGLVEGTYTYSNGSGLYDGGRFSALDLTRIMSAMHRHANGPLFFESLSIAGKDGTLAGRLGTLAGKVYGKTGTLDEVCTLAARVETRSGRIIAVAILMNKTRNKNVAMRKAQDQLITLVADKL